MNERHISIKKTARYFVSGEVTNAINSVWIVCHGYGQLANYFLRKFEVLNNGKNLIVAPEGLHRFYLGGYSGRVGASWMTKEDRMNDIKDYIHFLDDLYLEILNSFNGRKVKINVLGFSQGTATVCRWLVNKKSKVNNLIIWAGGFPSDLAFEPDKTLFDSMGIYMVFGDKDEFISAEEFESQEKVLKQHKIEYNLIRFEGKHEINSQVLTELSKKI
ncbi:MAG: dienelactone hydrolase family protein [Bacteroidetes bacterium]|nr:dienelactone hydrolase family protein [Bacteroidota bacterium]